MDLTKKQILVTGGAGFLGSRVVARLKERGVPDANIRVPRREETDLRSPDACAAAVNGMDAVIHCAGVTGNPEFHRDRPAEMYYDNLMMGVYLMDAARRAGVEKFVNIGSATEYPEHAPLPYREDNIWLGYPERTHAPYSIAKTMLLVQAQSYRQQYGFNAVHLLMTNMYGPGIEAERGFVISNLIERILAAKKGNAAEIEAWGTGAPTRDFLYVEDAAEGVVRAAEAYDKPEPVNLGSGWEISIKELTELLCRLMNFTGTIRWNTEKPDGVLRRMLDTTRAEREFGFRPRVSFEDGLRATIQWHEEKLKHA